MNELEQTILRGLNQLPHDQLKQTNAPMLAEKLASYLLLLHKWNQAYNLTAVRDMNQMIGRHVMDSLAILPWLKGVRIIDVGTGAGLPGIPLALARPDLQFVLLDSDGKKTRFLTEVKRVLALTNVEIIQSRVEDYNPAISFDTVLSRAFSQLSDLLQWTGHLIARPGVWLAMKGMCSTQELQAIRYPYRIESYQVMEIVGKRCCVMIDNM